MLVTSIPNEPRREEPRMTVSEFFSYLLRRDATRELALALVYVHDLRSPGRGDHPAAPVRA
jgi:hypothetical protein